MSFYGNSFIWQGIPSEFYNLRILDFENTGSTSDAPAGSNVTIRQKWVPRRSSPYHFGNILNTQLEFDFTIGSYEKMSGIDRSRAIQWLCGQGGYNKLIICQDDISDCYANVIFTEVGNKYIGNVQQGIKLHAVCDSPWWYTMPKTKSYTFAGDEIQDFRFDLYNDSDDNGYNYPIVEFTLNSIGNSMTIINETDNNRSFLFTGVQPNETITIDNSLQTCVSSTGLLRLSNFNKQWFRLLPHANTLHVTSGIGTLDITYQFARKIGG